MAWMLTRTSHLNSHMNNSYVNELFESLIEMIKIQWCYYIRHINDPKKLTEI